MISLFAFLNVKRSYLRIFSFNEIISFQTEALLNFHSNVILCIFNLYLNHFQNVIEFICAAFLNPSQLYWYLALKYTYFFVFVCLSLILLAIFCGTTRMWKWQCIFVSIYYSKCQFLAISNVLLFFFVFLFTLLWHNS